MNPIAALLAILAPLAPATGARSLPPGHYR
jgi:hypothetical protein